MEENKDYLKDFISEKERLVHTLRGTSSGTFMHDFEKEALHLDIMAMKLLGIKSSTVPLEEWFKIIHPDDIESTNKKLFSGLEQKLENIVIDYRVKVPNTKVKHVKVNGVTEYKEGKAVKSLGIIIDITDLKQKEIELIEKNKELEQFTSIVSHDLLSPLNSIIGFSSLLEKLYAKGQDSKEKLWVNNILKSSTRMRNLIVELLEYSRSGNQKKVEGIDCNLIVKDVVIDLSDLIQKNKCEIKYDKLPIIKGNKQELRRLFQNIINNGIKFRKADTVPIITISAQKKNDNFEFSIKDNGIGIDKENFRIIFQMLERVSNDSNHNGWGIGLATCKKIVTKHGGDIWVESSVGLGSTFYFTIQDL